MYIWGQYQDYLLLFPINRQEDKSMFEPYTLRPSLIVQVSPVRLPAQSLVVPRMFGTLAPENGNVD